jgi:hypothetical protein
LEETKFNASHSLWWKYILLSGFVNNGDTNWSGNLSKWKPGNGKAVSFWKDAWIGDSTLKSRFIHLFLLPREKDGKIGDMGE